VLLAVAHVALVRFDEPVRARLTRRLLAKTGSSRPDVERAAPQRPEIAPRGMPGTETGSEVNLSPGDEATVRGYAPTEFA
jgi:hypothetical protein